MGPEVITLAGKGGRLLLGARLVARFDAWSAESGDGGGYTLRTVGARIDPIWVGQLPVCELTCEVTLGRHRIRHPAVIVASDDDGLTLEMGRVHAERFPH